MNIIHFQPPDLENVISPTISSNVFEYIYTLTRSKWHTRNESKTARKKQPHIKPYITGHKFPQVTSHLIQLIALFSHFSWFFVSLSLHFHPLTLLSNNISCGKIRFSFLLFSSTRETFLPSVDVNWIGRVRTFFPHSYFSLYSIHFIVFHPYK